jgi:Flp pilus assembly protein TadG
MHGKERKYEKGQSLVEFALSLPILILILSGLIDIGRVYVAYIFLEEAAAEAALYISLNPECVQENALLQCADPNNGLWRARYSGSMQAIIVRDPNSLEITSLNPSPGLSETIQVEAKMPFYFTTPGMSALMESINDNGSNELLLRVVASHVVLQD